MIIQNLVDDFYRRLIPGKNVLILCGLDVDALAGTRSLISLLQTDYVPYTLKPVSSRHDLFASIYNHKVINQHINWGFPSENQNENKRPKMGPIDPKTGPRD